MNGSAKRTGHLDSVAPGPLCSRGTRVAKYPIPFGHNLLLLERINVGGMAEVYRAKSFGVEGFERIVAIKRILPTLADDREFISMFVDEARIASHLTHQNIVQIYELGKEAGMFFISMEYVAGKDLRQILDGQKKQNARLDAVVGAFVIAKVCEALDYAHRKRDPAGRDLGIIHRDVTPQNVIISYQGEVKLCDFGIAKAASRISRTQVGVLKGKFAYMAPEAVEGHDVDRRADIFALGIIFYEMLTGQRLFLGESDYATLEAVRAADIPSPAQLNPDLSPHLEAIVLKMLARDPQARYQWASEVHDDLVEAMIQEGRLLQNRHLRDWMHTHYATAIQTENAKMDAFMKLDRTAGLDTAPIAVTAHVNPTQDYPALPAELVDALQDPQEATAATMPPSGPLGHSPVSNLFGTPHVEDVANEAEHEPSMVRPAGEDPALVGPPVGDDDDLHDRTVFDSFGPDVVGPDVDENETALGDGPPSDAVSQAQAEIRELLDRPIPPSTIDDLPSITEAADVTTVGNEDTQHGVFLPIESDADLTAVQADGDIIDSVFAVEDETPASVPRLPSETPPAGSPELTLGGLGGLGPIAHRARSAFRFAPIHEVNRPSDIDSTVAAGPDESAGLSALTAAPSAAAAAPNAAVASAAAWPYARLALVVASVGLAVLMLVLGLVLLVQPRQASLKVVSKPVTGVPVFLDGQLIGRTPVSVSQLELGRHRVQLEAEGFRQYIQTIRITEARPHMMMVPLEVMPPPPLPAGDAPLE